MLPVTKISFFCVKRQAIVQTSEVSLMKSQVEIHTESITQMSCFIFMKRTDKCQKSENLCQRKKEKEEKGY